ncbi:TRAP transporter substrate-binding protein [uncultured Mailhella sp.]|uniref:TRAP transporter substrate-binding protein n=1 Tax=uncultured Mailhella sp. TaxID=1981031 RepID=UPI0025E61790|nr:TRAP transporter substrate-binding protein [uncultured Mailhella sp.]
MNKLFRISCLCLLTALIGTSPAQAAPIPVKITTHATTSMAICRSLETMKKYVEEKTNGKYRIDIYDQFKLGTMESAYQGMQLGMVHFLVEGPSNLSNFMPIFSMFDLGYIFPDADTADEVLSGPVGKKILAAAANKAVTPLTFIRYSNRNIYLNKPVHSLADLKGVKVRASSSPVHIAVLKAMGLNPTPMPGSEVYTGLQQGVIDGVDVDITYLVKGKWDEVCKSVVFTQHTYLPQVIYTSTRWWNKLPEADRVIFQEALDLYVQEQRKNILEDEAECMQAIKDKNLSVYTPTPEEMAALKKNTSEIYKEFPKIDVNLLNELKAEAARVAAAKNK